MRCKICLELTCIVKVIHSKEMVRIFVMDYYFLSRTKIDINYLKVRSSTV